MNKFGGDWTKAKIEILVEYAKAYLTIMKKYKDLYGFKLLYFDGFAGTGEIIRVSKEKTEEYANLDITIGAARRIIGIDEPIPFDMYYFVEMAQEKYALLKANTKDAYPTKNIHVVQGDFNQKLKAMAAFLKKKNYYRTLAYIDPCGMQVEWDSIATLKGLNVDVWILVPTGMGVNRLLTKSGQISDAWLERLEKFLGMERKKIEEHFYTKQETLFEDVTIIKKEESAIEKSASLYQERLKEIFTYVSNAYELKNSTNSIMYHLFFASNNKAGVKIANDIVNKYKK